MALKIPDFRSKAIMINRHEAGNCMSGVVFFFYISSQKEQLEEI
jgi:hypothetical protein